MHRKSKTILFLLLGALASIAGPVTTVPWNGHTGAVSFTYDDARSSQIPNLLPQLDSLHIKATFFIAVNGTPGNFSSLIPQWIQVAQRGYELANHTYNHVTVPPDPQADSIVKQMAVYLRGLDPSIESVTFAYPGCGVNGEAGVGDENFTARGCGQADYAWGTQPSDWMNIQGLILGPTGLSSAVSLLNTAKSHDSWVVTIVHDVTADNPDVYSMTPSDNLTMLKTGIADSLWIDTYENIAAYYRTHFTMDTVHAKTISGGWSLNWVSPHPTMPRSVHLRVNLAASTFGTNFLVEQGDSAIAPQADGSYVIDFMKLSMNVLQKTTGVLARIPLPSKIHAQVTPDGIELSGVVGETEVTVADVRGDILFHGPVADRIVPLRQNQLQGLLFLTLVKRAAGSTAHAMINATH